MTHVQPSGRNRWLRLVLAAVLAVSLAVGVYLVWPGRAGHAVIAYFSNAVGLYPGDEVRVVGVPIGTIDSIDPQPSDVKITMNLQDGIDLPADARAIVVAPNLVSARFIQLTPAYTGGAKLADGAVIGLDKTGVPVEWDEVKDQLTKLSAQLGPQAGELQGPLSAFINQAADTFDGNGDSFRNALHELSQTAGRLGDSRTDLFGTIKNLQILINALSNSNEEIVEFSDHVASVSQVLADSGKDLDGTLATLNQALTDVKGFLRTNNDALIGTVNKLTDLTTVLNQHSDDIEQVLHVAPNGLANFYNIYNPAQGTVGGLLSLPNFANPVQFLCGGTFDTGASPDNFRRAEICRERMGPVLRRITMNYPPILFHPINSITAYKGQIIYDTPATEAKARTPLNELQWQPLPGVTPPQIPDDADLNSMLLPPDNGTVPGAAPQAAPGPGPDSGPAPADPGTAAPAADPGAPAPGPLPPDPGAPGGAPPAQNSAPTAPGGGG
jgi:phospholipid/cholesterol/gamma-HCH transport system substrate-binding protein